MDLKRALKIRDVILKAMQSVDDTTAVENSTLFPEWEEGVTYTKGFKVRYDGILYKVLQTHDSQSTWTPTDAPSLFAKILIPDETSIPEWEQPDSTNAYMTGDKVIYNGLVYESLIDNNVWSPDAYPAGWKQIID